jgi:hypothetical protein
MIVMDGNCWAQEKNLWTCDPAAPAGPDSANAYQNSAIVNHGPAMKAAFGPVLFSLHVYGMWGGNEGAGCTPTLWDSTFTAYVDHVRSMGLALFLGEAGCVTNKIDEPFYQGGSWNAVQMLTRVLPTQSQKLGVLFWHGQGGISFSLFDNPAVGWTANPLAPYAGTINWKGQFMYDYAHQVNP